MLQLIFAFFRIGLFAVGGGLATLPFLYQLSRETDWFSSSDISNMIAVSQSTPGPIGVNMATFVGFQGFGIPGAIVASLSLIAPSLIICLLVSKMLDKVKNSPLVQSIFAALRPASAGLILVAGINLALGTYWTETPKTGNQWLSFDWRMALLSLILLTILKIRKPHPVLLILIAAIAGVIFNLS